MTCSEARGFVEVGEEEMSAPEELRPQGSRVIDVGPDK
jgi:hypothetical protein